MIGRKDNNVINTAYRFRLFPDEHQEQLIGQNLGACRWLYNRMLSDRTETYRQSGISEKRTPAWYKHLHPYCDWLKKADSLALANVQLNLEKAFDSFFSSRSGYPKFKRKSAHYDSYTTNMVNNNIVLKRRHGKAYLHLPKIPGFMKMKGGRLPGSEEKLKSATVTREPDGKYYVSLLYEMPSVKPDDHCSTDKAVGLDMSMPGLCVTSDGETIDSPHSYRKVQERLAREQRRLSHMVRGSRNYEKQRRRIARLHAKAKHQRSDFLHKLSKRLVIDYDIIGIEDLDMKGMSQALNFGKSVMDKGWGMFVSMLSYKSERAGRHLVRVSKWYPSSQICHECGTVFRKTKDLSVREWTCPHCGHHHDRDVNAALNVRDEAVRILLAA